MEELVGDGSYRSTGLTSRGRIGIDAALTARALVNPWFTDEIDKEVLLQGLQEIVSTMPQGKGLLGSVVWEVG